MEIMKAFWSKSQAPHVEVGTGIEVGGELKSGRGVVQLPELPTKVQRREDIERNSSQQSKRQCRIEQFFSKKDQAGTVIRVQEKGSTSINKKRTAIVEDQSQCKKQTLAGRNREWCRRGGKTNCG